MWSTRRGRRPPCRYLTSAIPSCRRRCRSAGLQPPPAHSGRRRRTLGRGTRRGSITATRRTACRRRTPRRAPSCRRCRTRRAPRPASHRDYVDNRPSRRDGCQSQRLTRDGRNSTSTSSKMKLERSALKSVHGLYP